ncbi:MULTISPECIES: Crp/Fnr family transcriptional regulator [Chryseobacterium]|uniref:CRP-like cAMP-binding protein n=1 Tax=Chryseobacterium camelliae TaxID=1265445 RepID=A0ABU0TDW7_9FLAO|nr:MULTISPECIES: Crp/Fnr family transcriptional regulator [Chryseobacterium]MDT3406932.1 CRP-like cAMP-binding protein [Pseudacidovorax intermedius]MDQ1095275.1 CRP-like cAMP-binding protein [Chryseobacterium camelliae]MDQ1099213.1 CRP-like cAMP-binding protein [Chryseobacterium sp. SORGH_AS_1048]MDR6086563.1 CRP-like cAMP-binding protein [Chryseobacterium sp. SORGH_AS_0909]MDR6130933.1 CRP-like cAMP-binding protein [Chryseobacterium sp. SORGH_AS_1175]
MVICENLLFSHGAKIQNYKSGEFIFHEGSSTKFYFQIKTGTVKLTNFHEDGKEFIHGLPFEGHCFGETYLFTDKEYAVNAIAVTECDIIKVEKSRFHDLISQKPGLMLSIYRYTADRMHYKYVMSAPLSMMNPFTRLKKFFDHIKVYFGYKEPYSFFIPYTRQQLAAITGLRTETVIRTIKKMEREKLVRLDNSKIYY